MSVWVVIIVGLIYMAVLFAIASLAEQLSITRRNLLKHPIVYALSLGVYCTGWTYYGSVGRAATTGIDFISIYLGPTIMAGLFFPVLYKIIRISRTLHLTSLADFISVRYGKNFSLGILVSLACVIGVIPYIALQLKAIVNSFQVLYLAEHSTPNPDTVFLSAVFITLVLSFFTILYGARSVDATEKHPGLIAVIVFESIIKLVAFLALGVYVTYGLFDGMGDIFSRIAEQAIHDDLFTLDDGVSYQGWTSMIVLSLCAFLFLPRQFHIGVVENTNPRHLRQASWLFPVYLLLINLFVMPIALGGLLLFGDGDILPDNFVLAIPLHQQDYVMALTTWIGGTSAATGMIIVETIGLSIMISNNLVMPLLYSSTGYPREKPVVTQQSKVLLIRRLSIVFVLMLALAYYLFIGMQLSLVFIGLISFCAVAQFAPATFGGIFWKEGNKFGALSGMLVGFIIWFYTLIIPDLAHNGILSESILTEGPFGITWLIPTELFGLQQFDIISHALFWSLTSNTICYIVVSIYTKRSSQEVYYAAMFVNAIAKDEEQNNRTIWRGTAYISDLLNLLSSFVGTEKAGKLMRAFAVRNNVNVDEEFALADNHTVAFTERTLGGIIGAASARILMQKATKEEDIRIDEVVDILQENKQIIAVNKELRKKSTELSKASKLLQEANDKLLASDKQKDEFLYTVTHELRTPMTSIRALSEIVYDNPDLDAEQKQLYLGAVVKETERLSHLISQVLKLEQFDSGRQQLYPTMVNLNELIRDVSSSFSGLIQSKELTLDILLPEDAPKVYCDRDMIGQVLVNIIGNAVKFSNTTIRVKLEKASKEWEISISDDGKGVDSEVQEFIFDKFFQAKNQTLKKPEGSGLGLAICKKIVQLHGGRIWVSRTENNETQFVFTLPDLDS